jgi:glycosyltransferase involved in cell wall biosynthesis
MKVYLDRSEGENWSLDRDRQHIETALTILGHDISTSLLSSNVVYSVWWDKLLNWKYQILKNVFQKKIFIATITNELEYRKRDLEKLGKIATKIVYANNKQKRILLEEGFNERNLYYSPFYVDETIFKPIEKSRKDIALEFNFDQYLLQGRLLIGSFQRDSLGLDLLQPKWQKNPDLLIDICKLLNDKLPIMLVLAGPRRHYVVRQCLKYRIPFIFIGDITYINRNIDDMHVNILSSEKLNNLYKLIDIYIVSSASEGGPKAIIESALSQTLIVSTDVGFAKEFLIDSCIYCTAKQGANLVKDFATDTVRSSRICEDNYKRCLSINNQQKFIERINKILVEDNS